ncbi:MAG: hypothetical protein AB7V32_11095 [Candidatus Berkiella sp.]
MSLEAVFDRPTLLASINTLRQQCEYESVRHKTILEKFLKDYGMPETIARQFPGDRQIEKLAISAKEYYASVKSVFIIYDNFLSQIHDAALTFRNSKLKWLLATPNIEDEYLRSKKLNKRIEVLEEELSALSSDRRTIERKTLINAELEAAKRRAQTYCEAERFLHNYFELLDNVEQSFENINMLLEQVQKLTSVLNSMQTVPASSAFSKVITQAKKKKSDKRVGGSWGACYDDDDIEISIAKLQTVQITDKSKRSSSSELSEDWDAEFGFVEPFTPGYAGLLTDDNADSFDNLDSLDSSDIPKSGTLPEQIKKGLKAKS